jgi:hypothetical protein
LKKYLGRRE